MNPEEPEGPSKNTHSRRAFLKELGIFSAKIAASGWGTDVVKKVDDTRRIFLAEQSLQNVFRLKSHLRFVYGPHTPNTEGLNKENLIITGETSHWQALPIPEEAPEESTFVGGSESGNKSTARKVQAEYSACKAVLFTDGYAAMPEFVYVNANSVNPEMNVLVKQFIRHYSGAAIGGAIAVKDKDEKTFSRRNFLGIATGATLGFLAGKAAEKPVGDFLDISDIDNMPDEINRELWKSVLPLSEVLIDIRDRSMILNSYALNPVIPNIAAEGDEVLFNAGDGHEEQADLLQHDPKNIEAEFTELMNKKVSNILQAAQKLVTKYESINDIEKVVEAKVKSSAFLAALILQSAYPPTILINDRVDSLAQIRSKTPDLNRPYCSSAFLLTMKALKELEHDSSPLNIDICTNTASYISLFIKDTQTNYWSDPELGWSVGYPVSPVVGQQDDFDVFGTKVRHIGGIITKVE